MRVVSNTSPLSNLAVIARLELLHAKFGGALPAVKPELERLRTEAGFFIDHAIERFILLEAGE